MAEDRATRNRLEVVLVLMIPVATVLAGLAGFFAASEQRGANSARETGFIALSDSNTNALVANQIILRDEQLLIRAEIAERDGNLALAMELRARTVSVKQGYLDLEGNATPAYDGDLEVAKAAFVADMYLPHLENRTVAEEAFALARTEGQRGQNFLLATILFAATAVLGTFARQTTTPRWNRLITTFTVAFLAIPVAIVLLTVGNVI
jgi:hypothetical protein